MFERTILALALVAFGAACGGTEAPGTRALGAMRPASLETAAAVRQASDASAAAVYQWSQSLARPWIDASEGSSISPPGACPRLARAGATATIETGCVDADGFARTGTIEVTRSADGARTEVRFRGWDELTNKGACGGQPSSNHLRIDGVVRFDRAGDVTTYDTNLAVTAQVVDHASCALRDEYTVATDYAGTRRGAAASGPWQFDGHGRVGHTPLGFTDATTVAEVIDHARCRVGAFEGEPVSGTTTLTSGGATVVLTYDGATDCDRDGTVRWSYNGADRGEIAGVHCAVGATPGRASAATGALAALGMAALLALRKQRRRTR